MGFKRIFIAVALTGSASAAGAPAPPSKNWVEKLRERMPGIEDRSSGELGVFVKDLRTGEEFSHRGDESWYVASGVKLPIAVQTLKLVDARSLTLKTRIELVESDFVDGAGETNSHRPGTRLSVAYLIGQMMVHSDNTASDLLLKTVNLAEVNGLVENIAPGGFSPITTLADVRRLVYSEYHPAASGLSGSALLKLKRARSRRGFRAELARTLNLKESDLRDPSMAQAFSSYYGKRYNSASLRSYARFIEATMVRDVLSPPSKRFLLKTMASARTGEKRIKAGLPSSFTFAHKTGTQKSRICDLGLGWGPGSGPADGIIIAACVRDFESTAKAESALKGVGRSLFRSGVIR